MRSTDNRVLIGLSPRLLRNATGEFGFRGKTLQYLEQSVASWVMAGNAIAVMIPSVLRENSGIEAEGSAQEFAQRLDGLVLQGGADIHPSCYGQTRVRPGLVTDVVRDRFELELLRAFVGAGKPVLGVCRGMQLLNVCFGGSLYQDLQEDGATPASHMEAGSDEHYRHGLRLSPGSWLSRLYAGISHAQVNSIHHQGIDRLADRLSVEARSDDGVIEAIRHLDHPFVVGVQWHPEFHGEHSPELLAPGPLMAAFLEQAARAGTAAA